MPQLHSHPSLQTCRVLMQSHMRMIFEIRDLKYATPATVSRAGILYISTDDGTQWKSLLQSWLKTREEPQNIKDAFQVCSDAASLDFYRD